MQRLFSILIVIITLTSCTKNKNKLTVLFDRVDGLNVGSNVQNKGVKIGEVRRLDLFGKQVLAVLELKDKIQVPVGSKFTVTNNILSTSVIDIEFANETIYLSSKDTVNGNYFKIAILDELISDSTKKSQIESSLQKIATGVKEIVETIKKDSTGHK